MCPMQLMGSPHYDLSLGASFLSSGAQVQIFLDNWVNAVATDALAPCIGMSSAAMVSTLLEKKSLSSMRNNFNV